MSKCALETKDDFCYYVSKEYRDLERPADRHFFNFEITNSEINLYNCPYSSIEDKIKYSEIYKYLDYVLNNVKKLPLTFENLEHTDKMARVYAMEFYKNRCKI